MGQKQQAGLEQQWQLLSGCQQQQWQHDQQQQQQFSMICALQQQVWQLEQQVAGLTAQVELQQASGSVTAEQVQVQQMVQEQVKAQLK